MDIYRININSKLYTLEIDNYSILQLCEILHIGLPRFCYHEHLSIAGNCRMCLVELKNSLKPIVSCAYQIADNMVLFTNTQLVKQARENILEFLLINHPLDCPICDQGGECDLQDQTLVYGRDKSRFQELKRSVMEKNWGPFIKSVMTRCIHCTRCIRYFSEIAGVDTIGTIGRGMYTEIESYVDVIMDSEISGNVIDLCPVGALTSKPYSFTARPWELISYESLDLLDSYCSYIRIDLRSQNILRVLPVIKRVDYHYWISDKIRFSYDAFKRQRLKNPKLRTSNKLNSFRDCSFEEAFKYMLVNYMYCINNFGYNNIYFFTGKFVDIASLLVIKYLTFSMNVSNLNIFHYFEVDFRNQYLVHNNLIDIEYENSFLIYGLNTKIESAILNIKLRKLALASNTNKFYFIGNHIEVNYPMIHIGLSMMELLDIYHGKHFVCHSIINHQCFNFLHGPDSYFDEYSYYIAMNLRGKLNKLIQYSYNNLFSNDTSIYEYNACSRSDASLIDIEYNPPKYIYLINSDIASYFKKDIGAFLVYQSHNFDEVACYANVILPTGTHLDKKGYYINYQGDLLYSGAILSSTELKKHSDTHIFFAFYNYLKYNGLVSKKIHSTLWNSELLYEAIKNTNNLYFQSKVVNTFKLNAEGDLFFTDIITNRKKVSKKLFLDDSFFLTTNRNYYTMDIFSRNSVYISNFLSYKQIKQINIYHPLI